ncbi:MAG TPA: hypothetical protein VH370_10085 [Humisphaera sp.]|nr:hypothetical protein [Humisphaera sp.]
MLEALSECASLLGKTSLHLSLLSNCRPTAGDPAGFRSGDRPLQWLTQAVVDSTAPEMPGPTLARWKK